MGGKHNSLIANGGLGEGGGGAYRGGYGGEYSGEGGGEMNDDSCGGGVALSTQERFRKMSVVTNLMDLVRL